MVGSQVQSRAKKLIAYPLGRTGSWARITHNRLNIKASLDGMKGCFVEKLLHSNFSLNSAMLDLCC